MPDMVLPGPVEESSSSCRSVNIHTSKIFDCCRDKDCVEDLRVYPTVSSQALINSAFSVRPSSAVLLYADVDVDAVSFNRGYYTVDVTYFYKVTGNTFPGGCEVTGLAVFDKRVILFGSEGAVKVFSSGNNGAPCMCRPDYDQPVAYVEAVDPIALNMKILDSDAAVLSDTEAPAIPQNIVEAIGEELVMHGGCRKLYVTLGQFSIIRLERATQLTLDDVEYFFPDKECVGSSEDDPCTLFGRVRFPVEEFFPPDSLCEKSDYKDLV
jgi:hypothetical protein